jgi:hypothetical protein
MKPARKAKRAEPVAAMISLPVRATLPLQPGAGARNGGAK